MISAMSQIIHYPLLTTSSSSSLRSPFTSTPFSSRLRFSTKRLAQSEDSVHFQYQPAIWDKHFVESVPKTNYVVVIHKTDTEFLVKNIKQQVKGLLKNEVKPLAKLELIEAIQRLGMSYLIEEDILKILESMYHDDAHKMKDNLYATSLVFRLLRQHGFHESQDIFSEFRHGEGGFKETIIHDIKGMLNLFEAAHLLSEGEIILSEAILFTRKYLLENGSNKNKNINVNLAKQVDRSLETPFHWRVQRSETRFYIETYESQKDMNPRLLELAKVNYNMVQAQHKMELMHVSRWWNDMGIAKELYFARDRLVECFLSNIGACWEPRYGRCREWVTKIMSFALVIDDIYDSYGSLEELDLFTCAIDRWDSKAVENLPYYMKRCFLALFNTVNEMAFEILSEKQFDILPHLTNSLANSVKAMLTEAKWCHNGYVPTSVEYQHNGSVSSVGYVFLMAAYFTTNRNISDDVLQAFENNHPLIYYSCLLCRLSNDLATSSAEIKRGEVASSIYCYMQETNVSEEDAREHVKSLIHETFKGMNRYLYVSSPFDRSFVNIVLNFARTTLLMYQYGDGIGAEHSKSIEHVLSMIVNPIHIDGHTNKDSS
ncbi:exo-alpha-bergamotene synthase-like isoform X1 [Papaver somniferum]|uniref:exo-alpha-bergamotene synthase-like isoform X1 n=1 Tax=Papaver somniferum TaxID=3469 RepID=UPI000E6FA693|nr:exo-alpha-bergamotene synthase-like isoform X1 [Papaver somniferum]